MDTYPPLLCAIIRFPTQDPAMSADTLANTDLALGIPIV